MTVDPPTQPRLDIDAIEADLTIRERVTGEQGFYETRELMQGKRSGTTIGDADRRVRAAVPALVAEVRRLREALTGALYELRHVADTSQCEAILAAAVEGTQG